MSRVTMGFRTYQAAWETTPVFWREVVERDAYCTLAGHACVPSNIRGVSRGKLKLVTIQARWWIVGSQDKRSLRDKDESGDKSPHSKG
ncbi:MAG TPA: hypothetical protein VFI31_25005 [Pirellulales bacterium]|nr:hypothetical protein [Pirellulales bacterium]